jgi:hypothetical protein
VHRVHGLFGPEVDRSERLRDSTSSTPRRVRRGDSLPVFLEI